MLTRGGALCCACDGAADNVAAAMAATLKYRLVMRVMRALLVLSRALVITAYGELRSGRELARRTQLSASGWRISMHSPLSAATASVAGTRAGVRAQARGPHALDRRRRHYTGM